MRALFLSLALLPAALLAAPADELPARIADGAAQRCSGNTTLAIQSLTSAYLAVHDDAQRSAAAAELGVAHLQARNLAEAGRYLNEAYRLAGAADKARYAIDLGNWAIARHDKAQALAYWQEARRSNAATAEVSVAAALDIARIAPRRDRLAQLHAIAGDIARLAESRNQARFRLNLGAQAAALGAVQLAHENLAAARDAAVRLQDRPLQVEALDALAQLYEDQQRPADALLLTDSAIAAATQPESRAVLISLEWRKGRLHRALHHDEQALAAYRRAVDALEAARPDIPVAYEEGRSSFRETLEPIYLGFADLLLKQADRSGGEQAQDALRRARDTVELIKQSELQDYLGDRCTVDTAHQNNGTARLPAGTEVLYPILLPDRLELLLETGGAGIRRHTVMVPGRQIQREALAFALALREGDEEFMAASRRLYDWFLRPFEAVFAEQQTDTLVVVPDGALRLVPFGALNDGQRYAIEKFAIATAPGLSITKTAARTKAAPMTALLAGLSDPGPVVDKLLQSGVFRSVGSAEQPASRGLAAVRTLRALRVPAELRNLSVSQQAEHGNDAEKLRKRLLLPGVTKEIETLSNATHGQVMVDAEFTESAFRKQVESGSYSVVHIASHGLFGGSAADSFILSYDDLITIDGLQALLRAGRLDKAPIDLVTLSACQTAEGDDRAPLGIAGAALKARARSALGTLWPVSDDAAKDIMARFYAGLASGKPKAQSLRESQAALIGSQDMNHPFFWAPFIIVGDWL
jgi:CHAT domain-containing protein